MTTPERPKRCCPKCQATSYLFRARKTVEDGKFVETKHRCRSCSHQWWDRVPAEAKDEAA